MITGASLGSARREQVFDDANVARLLDGEQFIDVIPTSAARRDPRQAHHAPGQARGRQRRASRRSTDAADVIKLAGRGGACRPGARSSGSSAIACRRSAATPQLAIAAGIDALRDAGIPLVLRYKTTSHGHPAPASAGRSPEELRDDTGVIFASALPGLRGLITERSTDYERIARAASELRRSSRCAHRMWSTTAPAPRRSRRSTGASTTLRPQLEQHAVRVRPPLPLPGAVDGPFAARRADRRARSEHPDQRGLRQHDAGGCAGRGLDPRRALSPRGDRGRRRRHLRPHARVDRRRASSPPAPPQPTRWSRRPRCRSTAAATGC